MFKRIDLRDGSKYVFSSEGFLTTLTKYCCKNEELEKTITFQFESDFLIDVFVVEEEIENCDAVNFTFEQDDPLYSSLNNLLGDDEICVIDDDLTREEKMKFIKIARDNNNIIVTIENRLKQNSIIDKFNVCVINMAYDGRSKIDQHGYDTKFRLKKFFRAVVQEFLIDKNDTNEAVPQKVYKNNI